MLTTLLKSAANPNPDPVLDFETLQNRVPVDGGSDGSRPTGSKPLSGASGESKGAVLLESALKSLPEAGGDVFGFKLVRELGRGAFGRVFLATQPELAGRMVALKVSADLRGESRALAQLQHTNIVPVYSTHRAGVLQGVCMPFFGSTTMADLLKRYRAVNHLPASGRELVATLQNLSRRSSAAPESPAAEPGSEAGPVPQLARVEGQSDSTLALLGRESYVRAICWLGARLADGLAHAHERGLLHRDIKPANVLLTDYGQPMLLDFGIAEDMKLRTTLTSASAAGTLPYMAPEHLDELRTGLPMADARSDIYALGIVLFELLTGRYPFRAPTGAVEDEIPKLIAERNAGAPELRKWSRDISPALESIVRTCLQPDPRHRYQSAAELRGDLDRYLAHGRLKIAPEPSLRERFNNWSHRHPLLTSNAVIGGVLAALLACGGVLYLQRQDRVKRLEAERAYRQFEGATKSAQYLVNSGTDQPKLLEEGLSQTRAILDKYGVAEAGWEKRANFAALPPELRDKLREELAVLCMEMARGLSAKSAIDPEKDSLLKEAIRWNALAETISGRLPHAVLTQRAKLFELIGRKDDAEATTKKAEDEKEEWTAAEHTLEGNQHLAENRFAKALPHFRKALRLDPKLFWAHIGEGACHVGLGRLSDARGSYTAAVALWPEVAWGYYNRGLVELQLGDADSALEDLNKAAEIIPEYPELYWQRARAFQMKGKAKEGLRDLEEALNLGVAEEKFLVLRSELHALAGNAAAAKKDLDTALAAEPVDAAGWIERGRAKLAHDLDGALADFDKALELNSDSAHGYLMRAFVLKEQSKFEAALLALEKAVAAEPQNAYALAGRGLLYARFKKWELAKTDAKEALAQDAGMQIVYQVAAIYARLSESEPAYRPRSLDLLAVAVKAGMGKGYLANDPEFAAIRNTPEFKKMAKGE